MRLDFNVLWIDNLPQNVKSFQDRLEIKVNSEGFRLQLQTAKTFEEAQQYLAGTVFLDDVDLVLVDYDLGHGVMTGDLAVREIRNLAQYKEIILYSAIETVDLKSSMLTHGIEGVFCAHRDDLTDTMIGVFESIVKKVLDVDHCRGIVLGVTSDIDHIVLHCLEELASKLDPVHQKQAAEYALDRIDKRLERFMQVRQEIASTESVQPLLGESEAFTSYDRLGLLKKILTLHYAGAHTDIRKTVGRYADEVPKHRNELAHVRLIAEGSVRRLVGHDAKSVSADDLKNLRQLLIKYRDEFDKLAHVVGIAFDNGRDAATPTDAPT